MVAASLETMSAYAFLQSVSSAVLRGLLRGLLDFPIGSPHIFVCKRREKLADTTSAAGSPSNGCNKLARPRELGAELAVFNARGTSWGGGSTILQRGAGHYVSCLKSEHFGY